VAQVVHVARADAAAKAMTTTKMLPRHMMQQDLNQGLHMAATTVRSLRHLVQYGTFLS
jgi:peptidyl-tRNA hydrolase